MRIRDLPPATCPAGPSDSCQPLVCKFKLYLNREVQFIQNYINKLNEFTLIAYNLKCSPSC